MNNLIPVDKSHKHKLQITNCACALTQKQLFLKGNVEGKGRERKGREGNRRERREGAENLASLKEDLIPRQIQYFFSLVENFRLIHSESQFPTKELPFMTVRYFSPKRLINAH